MTVRFRYRARDADGKLLEGSIESPSRRTAIEDLRRQKLFPVDVEELGSQGIIGEKRRSNVSLSGASLPLAQALPLWTRTIATMLEAGIPLERALSFSAGTGNKKLDAAVAQASREIHGGSSVAAALRRQPGIFGALYIAMVTAGEETGALDQVMARLADHLDEIAELRARLRSALIYPALMGIVAGIGVTVLLLFVVPRFAEMLDEIGGRLPLSTRALMGMSDVVIKWWFIWIPFVLLALLFTRRWISAPENRRAWHAWRLSVPVTGEIERNYSTVRFTRTLGLLLKSGVGLVASLRMARSAVSNLALAEQLERATGAVVQGKRLAPELHGILPPLAGQLIAVGEESGRLDELCLRAAESYDRETSRRVRTLISLLEPILILLFGLLVGFVALAMLQAVYSVNAQVL